MTTCNSMPPIRILDSLPKNIQTALLAYAEETKLTAQAVIEGAIARFLSFDASLTKDQWH